MKRPEAIMEMKPGRYFLGVWYFSNSEMLQNRDWMGVVFEDQGDDHWCLRYRHEYYHSAAPRDREDVRSGDEFDMDPKPEAEVIAKTHEIVKIMAAMGHFEEPEFVYPGTDDTETIVEKLKGKDRVHVKIIELDRHG
jgi:hypothetical protein